MGRVKRARLTRYKVVVSNSGGMSNSEVYLREVINSMRNSQSEVSASAGVLRVVRDSQTALSELNGKDGLNLDWA